MKIINSSKGSLKTKCSFCNTEVSLAKNDLFKSFVYAGWKCPKCSIINNMEIANIDLPSRHDFLMNKAKLLLNELNKINPQAAWQIASEDFLLEEDEFVQLCN